MEYTGSSFKGDTKNDKMEGKGVYTFPSGTKYEGEFKDGAFHGEGTLLFKNGELSSTSPIPPVPPIQLDFYFEHFTRHFEKLYVTSSLVNK